MTSHKQNVHPNQTNKHLAVSQEARTSYAEITIAALTGEISATHLFDPTQGHTCHGSTSGIWPLERALSDLVEGGYIIDLRPLAEHPQLVSWVFCAPMPNGQLEGDEKAALSDEVRQSAREMLPGLQGTFQQLALLIAIRAGEPMDGSAGPFDTVSASYRARYWGSRGARIGKRMGRVLCWSDGEQSLIGTSNQ